MQRFDTTKEKRSPSITDVLPDKPRTVFDTVYISANNWINSPHVKMKKQFSQSKRTQHFAQLLGITINIRQKKTKDQNLLGFVLT